MSDMIFCQGCGKEIHQTALACPHCGALRNVSQKGKRNRIAAALFAVFLGGLGAHKFYLGKVGQGILYLVFCWTLIPSLISIVEFIIYLTMSDEKFAEKYG